MGAAIALRTDFDGATLRRLARKTKNANQSRRLLALAEIYDGGNRGDETRFKKVSANLYYRLLSRLSSIEIPRNVGDFRLVDANVIDAIRSMPERDRYLRGMCAWVCFRQTIVQFHRPQRLAGETRHPLKKMMRLSMDGAIGFSDVPLRLALWLGALVSLGAMIYGVYIFATALFTGELVEGWASIIVVLSFPSGMNFLISGVIGLSLAALIPMILNGFAPIASFVAVLMLVPVCSFLMMKLFVFHT